MKYKVTLNGRTYEVEVEAGKAMCVAEYEAYAPAAAPVAAPVAAAPVAAAPVAAPAASGVTVSGGESVTAPMPGNILKVAVSVVHICPLPPSQPAAFPSDLLRPSPNYRGTSGLPVSLIFRNLF